MNKAEAFAMKRKVLTTAIIPVLIFAALAALTACRKQSDNKIRVSGNIELTEIELSFKTGSWLVERLVDEGDAVTAGQLIARLDDVEIMKEVARHEALVAAARSTLAELERGFRPEEIREGEAALDSARADLDRLKSDFARQKQLFEREVISAREFEAIKSAYDVAEARVKQAEERLAILKEGPRIEKIELARASLEQAEAALAIAERQLENTALTSPIDGLVLSQNAEVGEFVTPGAPIVTVGNLKKVWLRAYIDETDLGRVKVGQKVKVTADTYPDKSYEGRITFIASEAEFTPKSVQTEKERVKLVYRIKVDIPNENDELKPGMPADGEIVTQ